MRLVYISFLLSTLCVLGCGPVERISDKDQLAKIQQHIPVGATPIKYLGNGWYIFEAEGELFMYRKIWGTIEGQMCTHIATTNKELRAELAEQSSEQDK